MLKLTIKQNQSQDHLANLFAALADPTRIRLIRLLLGSNDKCVSELATALGLSVSAISQNLKIMELNHLVRRERRGQKICYQLRLEDPYVRELVGFVIPRKSSYA